MKRFWAGVAVVALAAGCGSSPDRPPTAIELARRLVKAGLCHDAVPEKHDKFRATCQQLSGIPVGFQAFPTHRQLVRDIAESEAFFCQATGGTIPFEYVAGRTWLVSASSSTLLTAKALGGHMVKPADCPAPGSVVS